MLLTWEFPPRVVGGVSTHVLNLSKRLEKNRVKVYVVTCDFPGAPQHETINEVEVFRVDSYKNPAPDFATWVYLMNMNMQQEAAAIIKNQNVKVDILHAHDWLVATAGIGLKHIFRKPLIATIHSTETGRRNGINTDYERMIHETEHWLAYEAWKVICCSNYMASHVRLAFGVPKEKLIMIPNGVNPQEYANKKTINLSRFRGRFALPKEKVVLFVGRLVYEKGIHVLVNSLPKVLERINAKIIVVGDGYMKEQLSDLVKRLGLAHKVFFTGFIDDETLKNLQICADVCVVPSLFEPFGIVALEAMAAGTPVVVSDTGGLSEIVEHDITGVKVYPDNPDSLAWGITRVLLDKKHARLTKNNAIKSVQNRYSWDIISRQTKGLYEAVINEYSRTQWATSIVNKNKS
jgi:glycosyltransferase involved in cell wall biosynthesis